MTPAPIASLEELREALQAAVELELATIPPYLCAWWTISDRRSRVARMVAEERPDPPAPEGLLVAAPPPGVGLLAMGDRYGSVGAFRQAIVDGIERLVDEHGEAAVLPGGGRTGRQCRWFGDQDVSVPGATAALRHLGDLIVEGEGEDRGVCENGSVAHHYRSEGMRRSQEYRCGDTPGAPTGRPLPRPAEVAVGPMVRNPRIGDYGPGSPLHADAAAFDAAYTAVLGDLHAGFDGEPAKVGAAVGRMLQLREAAERVPRHPVGGGDGRAGPTFEWPATSPA